MNKANTVILTDNQTMLVTYKTDKSLNIVGIFDNNEDMQSAFTTLFKNEGRICDDLEKSEFVISGINYCLNGILTCHPLEKNTYIFESD
jgi:hypothetical protein